jgi:hypothetical protein
VAWARDRTGTLTRNVPSRYRHPPRYSSDGAVQYALARGASKIVFDQSNVPGTGYIAAGPAALGAAKHVPITQLTENVPITDANSVAIKEVDDAGPNGAVVLNFTPPEALIILQAAQKLGLGVLQVLTTAPAGLADQVPTGSPEHNGALVILVDHDMSLVSGCCTTTAVLDFGKLIASGPTAEVLRDDRVVRAYLGTAEAT